MKNTKFFVSTLIAAAAMTATAWADVLDGSVLSIDSFDTTTIQNLQDAGWSISNISGSGAGTYTTTGTQGSISTGTSGVSLTSEPVSVSGATRYLWSAIVTVNASVFAAGNVETLLLGNVGLGGNGTSLVGRYPGSANEYGKIENVDTYAKGELVTLGVVYDGNATNLYVLGKTASDAGLRDSKQSSEILFSSSQGVSYSNLYWFNSALSSETMGYAMTDVSGVRSYTPNPDSYYWSGTADNSEWNATATNWEKSGNASAFASGANVVFDGAANKTVAINEAVSAGTMKVASDYVFNVGTTGSLSATEINVIDNCVATLNIAGDMTLSSAVSGAGTLKKTGTGTLTYSGTLNNGATLEISEGSVDISSGGQQFKGNLTIGAGATVKTLTTEVFDWAGVNKVVLNGGVLNLGNGLRQTFSAASSFVFNGGTITEDGSVGDGYGALDLIGEETIDVTADTEVSASVRLRNNLTLNVSEGVKMTLSREIDPRGDDSKGNKGGGIIKNGEGLLVLSGANDSYNNKTVINAGTLSAQNGNALGTGAIAVNGGVLDVSVSDGVLTQADDQTITTTGEGKITVSSGTLALTGAVNLSNAIENSGTVTATTGVVFALGNLEGTREGSTTTFSLVSGGTTTFENGMGIRNVDFAGTDVAARGATVEEFRANGSVVITEGTAGTLIWAGTAEDNTWNSASTNWTLESDSSETSFMNRDNVVFKAAEGVSATVNLTAGQKLFAGTVSVESGNYTLKVSDGTGTINGSSLSVGKDAILSIGNSGNTDNQVVANFDNISVAGTLQFNNGGASTWSSVTLGEEAKLHIEDGRDNGIVSVNLTVGTLNVAGGSAVDFTYGKHLKINELVGDDNLTVTGGNGAPGTHYWGSAIVTIDALDNYTGTLTLKKGAATNSLTVNTTVAGLGSAKVDVGEGTVLDLGSGSVSLGTSDSTLNVSGTGTIKYSFTSTGEGGTGSGINLNDNFKGTIDYSGNLNWGGNKSAEDWSNDVTVHKDATLRFSSRTSDHVDEMWGNVDWIVENKVEFGAAYGVHLGNANLTFNNSVNAQGTTFSVRGGTYALTFNGESSLGALSVNSAATINLNGTSTSSTTLNTNFGTINIGKSWSLVSSEEIKGTININDGGSLVVNDGVSNGQTSKIFGTVNVYGGGTLKLAGHDALGYDNRAASGTIVAQGTSSEKCATILFADTAASGLTLSKEISLKGHTIVKNADGNNNPIKAYGGQFTASGTNNTISSALFMTEGKVDFSVDKGGALTVDGAISGSNSWDKLGEGVLTLSGGNSSYTGTISVAGTLVAASTSALGSGNVSVANGAKLQISVENVDAGTINLASGATLAVDLADFANVLGADEKVLTILTGTTLTFGDVSAASDTLTTEQLSYLSVTDSSGAFSKYVNKEWSYDGDALSLTLTIPEPSAFGLLAGVGALALCVSRRRRVKKA